MKALSLSAPGIWEWIEIPVPEMTHPEDVLVRIHRVGICGTDYAGFLGKMPFFSYPRVPGHELGVEVIAVGPKGSPLLKPGMRCAVEPYLNCQKCYACLRGHTNCCESHRTLGVMCDGGLTEFLVLPSRKLHPSESLEYDQLALVETLGIGRHAVQRVAPTPSETVLVIGTGPIGLAVIEFAKLAGSRIIAMDLSPERLAFARQRMDVAETICVKPESPEEALEALKQITQGRLADVVVDATGNAMSMSGAMMYCSFAGRLVYVGITQSELQFPHATLLHRRELTIFASRNSLASDFHAILRLMESGAIDTRPWLTHHSPFSQVIERFPTWLEPSSQVVKAIVHMEA